MMMNLSRQHTARIKSASRLLTAVSGALVSAALLSACTVTTEESCGSASLALTSAGDAVINAFTTLDGDRDGAVRALSEAEANFEEQRKGWSPEIAEQTKEFQTALYTLTERVKDATEESPYDADAITAAVAEFQAAATHTNPSDCRPIQTPTPTPTD